MNFTIKKYRLDYSIWAAYRAAQAGSSKAKGFELTKALKDCGVIEYIDGYNNQIVTQADLITYTKNGAYQLLIL